MHGDIVSVRKFYMRKLHISMQQKVREGKKNDKIIDVMKNRFNCIFNAYFFNLNFILKFFNLTHFILNF